MDNINSTKNQSRAVIWDLDGTLIDSTEYHWLTWRDALAAEGYSLTYDQFLAGFGKRNDVVLRSYLGEGLSLSEAGRIAEAKEGRYRELVNEHGIELLPGAAHWLARLKAEGWRQALATSAPRLNVQAVLAQLGIAENFDGIVSAEDVERGKPDLQVFLTAAAKAEVVPTRSIVVEDAPAGIEGGRRAGMRTIGVLTTHADLHADLVVHTLEELPDNAFDQLLGGQDS
ncbi:MAG: HAD family phosphatase [Pyrinomonadaceae bacterium]|nr:HAD family phosphatase [Pyrinomonadaceae bacterium]